jgi:hypothetical protein
MTTLVRRCLLGLVLVSLAACLDLTPSVVAKLTDDANPGTSEECQKCLTAPSASGSGCGEQLVGCKMVPICGLGLECTFSQGCYHKPDLDVPICIRACADLVGFRSTDSPETKPALAWYQCATTHCRDTCLGSDARAPSDDAGALDAHVGDAEAKDSNDDASGGACTNPADLMAEATVTFSTAPRDCGYMCFGTTDPNCAAQCMQSKGLSAPCAKCWGDTVDCGIKNCLAQCLDSESAVCRQCSAQFCDPALHACAGM